MEFHRFNGREARDRPEKHLCFNLPADRHLLPDTWGETGYNVASEQSRYPPLSASEPPATEDGRLLKVDVNGHATNLNTLTSHLHALQTPLSVPAVSDCGGVSLRTEERTNIGSYGNINRLLDQINDGPQVHQPRPVHPKSNSLTHQAMQLERYSNSPQQSDDESNRLPARPMEKVNHLPQNDCSTTDQSTDFRRLAKAEGTQECNNRVTDKTWRLQPEEAWNISTGPTGLKALPEPPLVGQAQRSANDKQGFNVLSRNDRQPWQLQGHQHQRDDDNKEIKHMPKICQEQGDPLYVSSLVRPGGNPNPSNLGEAIKQTKQQE